MQIRTSYALALNCNLNNVQHALMCIRLQVNTPVLQDIIFETKMITIKLESQSKMMIGTNTRIGDFTS